MSTDTEIYNCSVCPLSGAGCVTAEFWHAEGKDSVWGGVGAGGGCSDGKRLWVLHLLLSVSE